MLKLLAIFLLSAVADSKAIRRKRRNFDLNAAMAELSQTWTDEVVKAKEPISDDLNCDHAIDELLLRLPDFGSLFYALVNGWYLGQWADYSSCLADATDSQYLLASVRGTYQGDIEFTRGGVGKFTDGFQTKMGLCFPK